MQIIIDIPKEEYKRVMDGKWEGNDLASYIENGTIIQKERNKTMTDNEIKVLKMNLLGGMHNYMMHVVQDEELHDEWDVMGVPDEPSEEDLEFIAENAEEFARVVRLFGNLVWTDYRTNS